MGELRLMSVRVVGGCERGCSGVRSGQSVYTYVCVWNGGGGLWVSSVGIVGM